MSTVSVRESPDRAVELGRRVAAARRDAGFTQAALARRIGTSLWTVERMERGESDPSPHVRAVAAATGEREAFFELPGAESVAAGEAEGGHAEERRRRLRLPATRSATSGRKVVLGTIVVLVLVRLFSEKLHVLPKIATFVDIPLFLLLVAVAAGHGKGALRSRTPFFVLSMVFVAIAVLSTLANVERVAAAPVLVFVYGFLAPVVFYWAAYRLWPPGEARALSRLIVRLGLLQFAVVALINLPRFAASGDPDDISGTFGENAYQLVFFLILFATLVAGIATYEPRRLTARAAPLLIAVAFGIIFLAQYRTLLLTTAMCVLVAGAMLATTRGRGTLVASIVLVSFVGALGYVATRYPITKFTPTIEALRADPGFFVSARLRVAGDLGDLYTDEPHYIVVGTGPGTYSSRAWRTFAQVNSTSKSDVAGPYVRLLTGGRGYTTDVSDRYVLPRLRGEAVLGSYALTHPLSSYIALAAETGLLGLLLLTGVYGAATFGAASMALRTMRAAKPGDALPALLLATTISFTVLLQMAVFENWLEVMRVTVPTWILLGVATKEYRAREQQATR